MIIDGDKGVVLLDPEDDLIDHYSELQIHYKEATVRLKRIVSVQSVTKDGKEIELGANISSLKELDVALASGTNGVGLFRTEFLYMDRDRLPREDEQYEVYRTVARSLKAAFNYSHAGYRRR